MKFENVLQVKNKRYFITYKPQIFTEEFSVYTTCCVTV